VEGSCISFGLCARKLLEHAIEMKDKKPIWEKINAPCVWGFTSLSEVRHSIRKQDEKTWTIPKSKYKNIMKIQNRFLSKYLTVRTFQRMIKNWLFNIFEN